MSLKPTEKMCPMMFVGQSPRIIHKCIGNNCAWFTNDVALGQSFPKCSVLRIGRTEERD
jgi:hypothetical protein